jgi:hypothetical protein
MGLTKFISAYRIVHRLPGRLRIRIPVLKKLPEKWRIFIRPSTELIGLKKGITTAEVQSITGSLLIEYDPEAINEAGIVNWLEKLVDEFLEIETQSDPLEESNISLRFELLRNRLKEKGTAKGSD